MTGLWVIITVCVGLALGLLAGVPLGFVLGYDRANDEIARTKERKEANGTATGNKGL